MGGNRNKNLGSRAEVYYMNKFIELGFEFCKTARNVSTLVDGMGIDLVFVPYNVQIKAGMQKSMNPGKTLYYIEERLRTTKSFPRKDPIHKKINILIHRRTGTSGKKRTATDDLVYMSKTDFFNLINKSKNKLYKVISIQGNINKDNFPALIYKNYDKKYGSNVVLFHKKKTKLFGNYNNLAIMTFEFFSDVIKTVNHGDNYS